LLESPKQYLQLVRALQILLSTSMGVLELDEYRPIKRRRQRPRSVCLASVAPTVSQLIAPAQEVAPGRCVLG
jgi:hypothetical protein